MVKKSKTKRLDSNPIDLTAKAGRYGGTYAHKDKVKLP
jgi:hypothetical protein